jgi:ABC-type transport system involved in Fe-S cluster assembly fused permease/ATPase subunit
VLGNQLLLMLYLEDMMFQGFKNKNKNYNKQIKLKRGKILIDGIDIAELNLSVLRKSISIITQS